VVSRLALTTPLRAAGLFRQAAILVASGHSSACVQAIRSGRLAPIT
jgi:hypothetical protein